MASYIKRIYTSWRVSGAKQTDPTKDTEVTKVIKVSKAFDEKASAEAYEQQLKVDGYKGVQIKKYDSAGWQVRIRSKLAPSLTKTFQTKAMAEVWAKAREGEIVKRQFVDYREAERLTLGDLLRRHESERLALLHKHHPDRSRIAKLCRHPITLIRMSAIQPSDFSAFREQRLAGGFVEQKEANKDLKIWEAIKGTSVKRGAHKPPAPCAW